MTTAAPLLPVRLSDVERSVIEYIFEHQLKDGGSSTHQTQIDVRANHGRDGAVALGDVQSRGLVGPSAVGYQLRLPGVLALTSPDSLKAVADADAVGGVLRRLYETAPAAYRTRSELLEATGLTNLQTGLALRFLSELGLMGSHSEAEEDGYPDRFSLVVSALDFTSIADEIGRGRFRAFVPRAVVDPHAPAPAATESPGQATEHRSPRKASPGTTRSSCPRSRKSNATRNLRERTS